MANRLLDSPEEHFPFESPLFRLGIAVLARLQPLIFVPGQVVAMEGQHLTAVSFLKKGRVHLLRALGSDEEEFLRALGPNDNVRNVASHSSHLAQQSTHAAAEAVPLLRTCGRLARLLCQLVLPRLTVTSLSKPSLLTRVRGGGHSLDSTRS